MADGQTASPLSSRPTMPWAQTNGMWIAGRSFLDEVDQLAADLEAKWGAGRLRLLVDQPWREKFDRQRYLLNQALWHGDLEAVRRESPRMIAAWRKLDALATAAGAAKLDPDAVWEIALGDGSVAAIVRDASQAGRVLAEGRMVRVYTLDEIARILTGYGEPLNAVKATFPGATVAAIRQTVPDPLDAIHDTGVDLNDSLEGFGDAPPF